MAKKPPKTKKIPKKPEADRPPAVSGKKKEGKYSSGVGRRKSAVARVRIFKDGRGREEAAVPNISVNGKNYSEYFSVSELREIADSPLKSAGTKDDLKITVRVRGGGIRGQAEATRLGIARALVAGDRNLRGGLRDLGYLTRDARITERKKAGLKKARRAPQWKKR